MLLRLSILYSFLAWAAAKEIQVNKHSTDVWNMVNAFLAIASKIFPNSNPVNSLTDETEACWRRPED